MNLVIRQRGNVIAGLNGLLGWDWLYVQVLWVHETQRHSGVGSRLLEQAECAARDRGCIGSCLSTFTFQAPDFYSKHGYSDFGQIHDYPDENTMHFMSKRFEATP
ncbi:MAG: GNAT family N-acetyltransferase [Planctomycetota bacterium]